MDGDDHLMKRESVVDDEELDPFAMLDELWEEKERLRRAEEHAMELMPPAQRALDYGDYWILPRDGTVIFGYVPTLIEMAAQFSKELLPQEQVDALLLHSQYEMTRGWMSCEIDGERFYWINKTLCIPISQELYDKAREVKFEPTDLEEDDLAQLSLAMVENRSATMQHFRELD